MSIRLKIEIDADVNRFGWSMNRFWYGLDLNRITSINDLKEDILNKTILLKKIKTKSNTYNENLFSDCDIELDVEGFELPLFETTGLLREEDVLR